MQIIEGNKLSELCDYSFGDHSFAWNKHLTGSFEPANLSNLKFLSKAKEFEGKVMTLFIDNIRLYARNLEINTKYPQDLEFVNYLMQTNDLLALCAQLPKNQFIIFTSHEDTPIDNQIKLPDNVLKVYAVNALYNNDRIIPFPIGLQRQIGDNDKRLEIMKELVESEEDAIFTKEPNKLLYINCGVERNSERLPLLKFETNDWCTTRFDKDSKFFPYERYNEFLSELRDHKFVVCPKGHGYDTHRIWETLYMRRVPVMLDDPYFRRLLKGFEVLYIDKWENLEKYILEGVDYHYRWAQSMDLTKLDLNTLFKDSVI